MRYSIFISGIIVFLYSTHAFAEGSWGTAWDKYLDQPGTVVDPGSKSNQRSIRLKSGVVINQVRNGNHVSSTAIDDSGYGAVGCAWIIYVSIKAELVTCKNNNDADVVAELDRAIGKINDFIVKNSVPPITKTQLEEQILRQVKEIEKNKAQIIEDTGAKQECPNRNVAQFVDNFRQRPRDEFRQSIDKMLSVPRPPVSNPCL